MVYVDLVALINFLVDFLLLLGTNRLCGYPPGFGKAALAAAVGGVYGGLCLVPDLYFLGNSLWRVVSLVLISWIAFGFSKSALRRGVVFVLLSMALGGIALGLGAGGTWALVAAAAGVSIMCMVGFREKIGSVSYVPVELSYSGKHLHLTALCDTGNTLTDPVTGRSVLVVDCASAQQLTGLTRQQLCDPVGAIARAPLPGLRLIPYRSVGQARGLLLALRLQDVRIGNWKGSSLVAFSPDGLSSEGAYQALTGGTL